MNTTHPPGDAPAKQLPVSSSSQANPGRTTINRAACRRKSRNPPGQPGEPGQPGGATGSPGIPGTNPDQPPADPSGLM